MKLIMYVDNRVNHTINQFKIRTRPLSGSAARRLLSDHGDSGDDSPSGDEFEFNIQLVDLGYKMELAPVSSHLSKFCIGFKVGKWSLEPGLEVVQTETDFQFHAEPEPGIPGAYVLKNKRGWTLRHESRSLGDKHIIITDKGCGHACQWFLVSYARSGVSLQRFISMA
eukprot:374253_1